METKAILRGVRLSAQKGRLVADLIRGKRVGEAYAILQFTKKKAAEQIDKTLPIGQLLGFMWFGLLFFAGITSSVSMLTPIVAFFREEFGWRREPALCFARRVWWRQVQ